jgi:hypothetical protein
LANLSLTSEPDWPQFDFRGYGLENEGVADFPLFLRVFEGVIEIFDEFGSNFYQDTNDLEGFLSGKANAVFPNATHTQAKRDVPAPAAGLPTTGCEPAYDPANWNKAPGISKNNCYNYATNNMANNFAQPGASVGKPAAKMACADVVAAAKADGLPEANCDNACPKGSYKIALVIWPNKDFHWYRQDDTGKWSHKPGKTKATNLDRSKNPITDPRTADRGPYTSFCTCFCVGTCAKGEA